MIFHRFASQKERRKFGGSAFIEIQFCRLPVGMPADKLVADISHWKNDSLYVQGESDFYIEYGHLLDCGIYGNLESGIVDVWGINYYAPFTIDSIIEKLNRDKPTEYEVFAAWLSKAKQYNGFYILGM